MSSTRLSFLLSAARIPRRIPPSPSWAEAVGRGWATGAVLFFLFLWQLLKRLLPRLLSLSRPLAATTPAASCSPPPSSLQPGDPVAITDADLADLIEELEGKKRREELWEDAVEKKNDLISYNAKSCRQKDGPVKYLSTTTFEKCSTELLRDFYMDNEYRKKWDKTVVEHEQLEVDDVKAIEVGRTIKKFPLLTAREYILIWRLWEGKDCSYYCLIKDYEYPQLPRQKKYVRVRFFKSGWRIRRGEYLYDLFPSHLISVGENVLIQPYNLSQMVKDTAEIFNIRKLNFNLPIASLLFENKGKCKLEGCCSLFNLISLHMPMCPR